MLQRPSSLRPMESKADGLAAYFNHIYQCESLANEIADEITATWFGAGGETGRGPELIREWSELGCGIDMVGY